ncbi:hypothetical protein OG311_31185 [Streptomyces sp. NBC_01343]|uniref:hypothetical protein n=1 Tax=Streptomyces sp. NBC_01343 TaxID=2903832 RepID=UPI002E15254B|nr:hypothetical protein OG311_31185 [Streptomyces sp. NBC_01343]
MTKSVSIAKPGDAGTPRPAAMTSGQRYAVVGGALAVVAAIVTLGLVAQANAPRPLKMADQTGNLPERAYRAAKDAGYELIDIRIGYPDSEFVTEFHPTNVEGIQGLEVGKVLEAYADWTVCVTDPLHVDGSDDPFWSVDFFLVKDRADCDKGRILPTKRADYDRYSVQADKDMDAYEAAHVPTPTVRPSTPAPAPSRTPAPSYTPPATSGGGGTSGGSGSSGRRGNNPGYYDGNYDNDDDWHRKYGNPDEYYDGNYDNDGTYHRKYGNDRH